MRDISRISIIPTSHLDLFWLGDYRNCLSRGDGLIRRYLDRADESGNETFVIDTAIFAEHFLMTHPHYEPLVRRLIAEKRLEIGGAYIDRWENLVLGESLIRNIQIGRRWAKERLGIETRLAAHPDLPGLNAQTSQIYTQAGVDYYVTSRKIFHEGRIWRHVAPDGSAMHVMHWPVHYVFVPFREGSLVEGVEGHFVGEKTLEHEDMAGRYPHGTLAMSGSAGDLTGPEDFITRYGKDQRAYIDQFQHEFPEIEIDYAIPATVMQPYLDDPVELPEREGTFPSVWGVAPDEEMRFFHRVRAIERDLLDAETASVLAASAGRAPLPESAAQWHGLYGEEAFFAPKDLAPAGREFEWLWRMQVFTQDHNGGGEDGALSVFQKKVRHDRARGYAADVVTHAVAAGADAGARPVVFRTRFGAEPVLLVDVGADAALDAALESETGSTQVLEGADGRTIRALVVDLPESIGLHPLTTVTATGSIDVRSDADEVVVTTGDLQLQVSRTSGEAWLTQDDRRRRILAPAYAVRELGNDVTLATDEEQRVDAVLLDVAVGSQGALAVQVHLDWELLGVTWRQILTVWSHEKAVDVEIDVDWPALEDWQVRLPLLPEASRSALSFGTPFHGSPWDCIPEGAHPYAPDEISPEDQAAYREVQHWIAADDADGAVAVLTEHPAFRSDHGETSAVLLRTAASCGDRRLHWTNPGKTTWQFRVQVLDASDDVAALADRRWRRSRVLFGDAAESVLLENHGDDVRVSALYLDEDGRACVRLVNQSASTVTARLTGLLTAEGADVIDLTGAVVGEVPVADGRVDIELAPWRISTLKFTAALTEDAR